MVAKSTYLALAFLSKMFVKNIVICVLIPTNYVPKMILRSSISLFGMKCQLSAEHNVEFGYLTDPLSTKSTNGDITACILTKTRAIHKSKIYSQFILSFGVAKRKITICQMRANGGFLM